MRSVVHKAHAQILETGRLQLFRSHRPGYADGGQVRDFVYVKDAVAVTLYFHDHPEACGLFNCGTGRARSWLDLLNAIYAAMRRTDTVSGPVTFSTNGGLAACRSARKVTSLA